MDPLEDLYRIQHNWLADKINELCLELEDEKYFEEDDLDILLNMAEKYEDRGQEVWEDPVDLFPNV